VECGGEVGHVNHATCKLRISPYEYDAFIARLKCASLPDFSVRVALGYEMKPVHVKPRVFRAYENE
jgi:hypothetical protein